MKRVRVASIVGTVSLLMACGCNTPQSRIDDNQVLFATYPPDVQASIKSGQIQRGFDLNQVYMALGKPSKKNAQGSRESWAYLKTVRKKVTNKKDVYKYELERLQYEEKIAQGKYATEPKMEETITLKRAKVVRRVIFTDGRVTSWEDPPDMYADDWHP